MEVYTLVLDYVPASEVILGFGIVQWVAFIRWTFVLLGSIYHG